MRALLKSRFPIVFLFAAFALPSCDLFNSDDNPDTPTQPLVANVILVGQATVQASPGGFAEYLGQVTNAGTGTARNTRVSVNVFDGNNTLIDVGSATTVPADLSPSTLATFKVTTTTPLGQAITFQIVIEWD